MNHLLRENIKKLINKIKKNKLTRKRKKITITYIYIFLQIS